MFFTTGSCLIRIVFCTSCTVHQWLLVPNDSMIAYGFVSVVVAMAFTRMISLDPSCPKILLHFFQGGKKSLLKQLLPYKVPS